MRDLTGTVEVSIAPNENPDDLGYRLLSGDACTDFARGYPVCRAAVKYPADGYAAVFGWTQMVRSTDRDADNFEMDPIAIYEHVATPFAWYGLKPALFDAPSRDFQRDLTWLAHSFLCVSPDAVITREVHAVTGFSWGFEVAGGRIGIASAEILGPASWDEHLPLLTLTYPAWNFAPGFRRS
jgi:hypothetical protein